MLCRVADSLYWIGRYLERAEHRGRLLEVNLELMLYQTPEDIDAGWRRLCRILHVPACGEHDEPLNDVAVDPFVIAATATRNASYADSIVTCLARARENARQVREVISTEMWEQINHIHLSIVSPNGNGGHDRGTGAGGIDSARNAPTAFYQTLRRQLHLFAGIADATLLHGDGWRFLRLGRFIERAIETAQLLGGHLGALPHHSSALPSHLDPHDARVQAGATEVAWVGLLQSCTAAEAYTKKYTADPRPRNVAEFLLLSPDFPHSLRFAVEQSCLVLQSLERSPIAAAASAALARGAGRLRAQLEFAAVDEILDGDPAAYLGDVREQCLRIHDLVMQQYIAYPLELASVYA